MKSNNVKKCLSVLLAIGIATSGITVLAKEEYGTGLNAITAEQREQLLQRAIIHTGDGVSVGCTSLENVNILDSVEEIVNYAFCECSKLAEIDIIGGIFQGL